jgi:sulfite reductase (ferredoxin)
MYAQEAYEESKWSDAIYHSYAGFVNGAKAYFAENQKTNHQAGIIDLFDTVFVETNKIQLPTTLKQLVFQIRDNEPTPEFAQKYRQEAIAF